MSPQRRPPVLLQEAEQRVRSQSPTIFQLRKLAFKSQQMPQPHYSLHPERSVSKFQGRYQIEKTEKRIYLEEAELFDFYERNPQYGPPKQEQFRVINVEKSKQKQTEELLTQLRSQQHLAQMCVQQTLQSSDSETTLDRPLVETETQSPCAKPVVGGIFSARQLVPPLRMRQPDNSVHNGIQQRLNSTSYAAQGNGSFQQKPQTAREMYGRSSNYNDPLHKMVAMHERAAYIKDQKRIAKEIEEDNRFYAKQLDNCSQLQEQSEILRRHQEQSNTQDSFCLGATEKPNNKSFKQ